MTRRTAFLVCLGAALLPGAAGADELSDDVAQVRRLMEKQRQQIERLMGRIDAQEATLAKQEARIGEAVEAKLPKAASWVERIKWYGDLRYRHEMIDAEGKDDRHRHRVRARVGLKAKVSDNVTVGFQLASGSDDPTSTNQTLDGGFSSKGINLDLAYFDWHPASLDGFHLLGGKIKNPFAKPVGNSDLIWDGDVRPEGIGAKYDVSLGDNATIFARAGGFCVEERKSNAESILWAAQLGAKIGFPGIDKAYCRLGGSCFTYDNTKGSAPFFDDTDGLGNTLDASGNYAEDFHLVEGFAVIGVPVAGVPCRVFGDYVTNTEASSDNNGWLVGTAIGKCKKPGSWELVYNYRDLEADAVIGAFSDSDFIGGGTDGCGHKASIGYQITKRVKAGVTYFCSEVGLSNGTDYERVQVDLKLKL